MIRLLATLLGLALSFSSISAYAACSSPSGNEGSVIYSASAKQLQFCNGTNWVNTGATVQSVGGGSKPTFAGLTTSNYNGGDATNGHQGMNAACDADFPGSRMMRYSEFLDLVEEVTAANTDAWMYCDLNGCEFPSTNSGARSGLGSNCGGAASTSSSSYGAYYSTASKSVNSATCNNSFKILCVYD